jgi:hypothetical protein
MKVLVEHLLPVCKGYSVYSLGMVYNIVCSSFPRKNLHFWKEKKNGDNYNMKRKTMYISKNKNKTWDRNKI